VLEVEMRIRQLDAAGVAVDPADRAYVAQMHRLLERLLEGTGMELPSPTG
jgi:phosphate starvation-inducible protein PhoH